MADSATTEALPEFDRLWNYSDPAATEAAFNAIVPVAEASGNRSYHASLLTQIARTQGLQGKFDEAHGTLDRAEEIMKGEPEGVPSVRTLLERGRVFNSSGNRGAARPLFEGAYQLASALGEENLAIDAVHMIAIVEDPERAIQWNELALELTERAADPKAKRWQGPLYNNLGWTYMDRGEPERALELFRRNVVWHTGRNTGQGLFIAKWCVARTLRALGRIDEALDGQRVLFDEMKEEGISEDGFVYEELGECLLLKGMEDEARPMFARAYELLSQDTFLVRDEGKRLARLKELGGGQ